MKTFSYIFYLNRNVWKEFWRMFFFNNFIFSSLFLKLFEVVFLLESWCANKRVTKTFPKKQRQHYFRIWSNGKFHPFLSLVWCIWLLCVGSKWMWYVSRVKFLCTLRYILKRNVNIHLSNYMDEVNFLLLARPFLFSNTAAKKKIPNKYSGVFDWIGKSCENKVVKQEEIKGKPFKFHLIYNLIALHTNLCDDCLCVV